MISVIIPAYNEEKYILKTLDSINHSESEIIVVCNGCTDNTLQVVSDYAKKSGKCIKVFNLKEKNVSKARNFGARMAKNNKMVFLDADIVLTDKVLEKILETEASIGTCLTKPNVNKPLPKFLMFFKNIAHYFGACTGLIFCDKEIFEKVNGFDETLNLGEDGKFLRAAKKLGKYKVVNAFAYNNMRRFEKKGYVNECVFWIKQLFKKQNKYDTVR